MVAIPPLCEFGWKAPAFRLPATDGRTYALSDLAGPNGTLVVFMCNHCPYVKAILDRIIRDAKDLALQGSRRWRFPRMTRRAIRKTALPKWRSWPAVWRSHSLSL